MLGQTNHFRIYAPEKVEYAINRYTNETNRLYGVLDKRLSEVPFVAGDYSIADMATWPWIARFEWQGIDMNAFPNVKRWYVEIAGRPAVEKGYKVPDASAEIPMP
jgi:GST-like protein